MLLSKRQLYKVLKDTVPVGTDQNIEVEIFVEYKYTLNELLATKIVFQYA